MKLVVLYNDFDDSVLYIDGKAYQDIDETWVHCMMWLNDTVTGFDVEFRTFAGWRKDFPNEID
jgi:hypothetical protein